MQHARLDGFWKDDYVVSTHDSGLLSQGREENVLGSLRSGKGIVEPGGHSCELEEAIMTIERGHHAVSFVHLDFPVARARLKHRVDCCQPQYVNVLAYVGETVVVSDTYCVQNSIATGKLSDKSFLGVRTMELAHFAVVGSMTSCLRILSTSVGVNSQNLCLD